MSLSGTVKAELRISQLDTGQIAPSQSAELAGLDEPLVIRLLDTFTYGDDDDQINVYWHRRVSFLAAETKTFTLDNGSLIDSATGLGVAFETVLVFFIKPVSDNPRLRVRVSHDFADSWDTCVIDGDLAIPGGAYGLLVNAKSGWDVHSGRNKLRFSAGLGPHGMECDILLVGRGTRG